MDGRVGKTSATLLCLFLIALQAPPQVFPAAQPAANSTLIVVVTGLPEGRSTRVYVDGRAVGNASRASELVLEFPRGTTITLTADLYVEGPWGFSYTLLGIRRGASTTEIQRVTLQEDYVVVVCEYETRYILLSPFMFPVYALLILAVAWAVMRWATHPPTPRV